jgi:tripartite-type tricarboxylate transporter receptor subunit TctC
MRRSNRLVLWLALLLILASPLPVAAHDYPNHTIKIIVPTGVGGITDILARLIAKSMSEQLGQPVIAGVKMTHIAYRGVPQAQQAVMTDEVAAFFDTPITALPQIRAGTVRALGVSARHRLAAAPDIPTIAEAGLPDYEVTGWNGILAPARTPRPIIDKLNKIIVDALQTPEIQKALAEQGLEPAGNSPEEFAQLLHADIEKWKQVTRAAGIQPQ